MSALTPESRHHTEIIVSARNVVFDAYQITNAAGDAPELMFKDWDAKRMQTAVHDPDQERFAQRGRRLARRPHPLQPPG